ncbi:Acetyltransferase (GNAT) family protein [Saccharopolyspora kobensis]|uniref:Acetyltransferase (GNAT) family protein n=1 Tax=Saccharopolyspora kobensis TaxID=146035 RepID=A0A1H6DEA8_9PSEU|nr:GNAT family N-acetyltransferase [Saccharopolyspora kobensis]SEG83045.1 Acetyltransferase (GNAT) family protein [Saccharopolyspora kobensis]SFE27895.1 Acetyltransferase (GNAT) family protein [Saccharopolyspora kobensis]
MPSEITVRVGPRPGDLGTVLAMHGSFYAREHSFDERFEAHVAKGLAAFAEALGEARDEPGAEPGRLWLAERDGEVVGTVGLTDEGAGTAKLRWFLVSPEVRGSGVGKRLIRALLEYARERDFERILLSTVGQLEAAAHLYLDAGFRCTERRSVRQWGQHLDELDYRLDLR